MRPNPILQVDDDENDVLLLRYVFRTLAIPTPLHSVTDGQQALDYLAGAGGYGDRERHPLPCLVLLDLKMPGKGGFEVLEWIRAQPALRTLVVVVMTASADQSDIDRAYQLGANAYVIKPTGTDQLTDVVRALQLWWMQTNRFPLLGESPRTGTP